jgi:hypothetical protein
VLGIDEGGDAAELLRLGNDGERERGLARGFRPVDLDHAAARHAADAERDVEAERSGRDDFDVVVGRVVAQQHHRALAELLFDLAEGGGERLLAIDIFHRVFLLACSDYSTIFRQRERLKRPVVANFDPAIAGLHGRTLRPPVAQAVTQPLKGTHPFK